MTPDTIASPGFLNGSSYWRVGSAVEIGRLRASRRLHADHTPAPERRVGKPCLSFTGSSSGIIMSFNFVMSVPLQLHIPA